MREPHDIEKRITAYKNVITIIKEQTEWYKYRLKNHPLESFERERVYLTLEILQDTISMNETMIEHLKDDLDKALDKEVRGW